jgi:hypothetical protein
LIHETLVLHPLYTIPYKMVHRNFLYRYQAFVGENEFTLSDAGLGRLPVDPSDVRHHLVEVEVLVLVALDEVIDHRPPHRVGHARRVVNEQPRFLRRVVKGPPLLPRLGDKQAADHGFELRVPCWNLLQIRRR